MDDQRFNSVWDALEGDLAERASLKARSALLVELQETVKRWGETAASAGTRLGLNQLRMKQLREGDIEHFSLDELVRLAGKAGLSFNVEVIRPAA